MSFSSIKDQSVPVRLLKNMVNRGRVPHGLLLWGPAGVGKTLTALELAKALNCETGSGDGCGTCLACRKIAHGNHPDVKVIRPAKKSRIINVETIDFITELSAYRPFGGRWRLIIFQDADRMGEPAQNHFLKTLEEPPSETVFVLVTAIPRALLATIRSRCQSLRFGTLRPETVTELLMREREIPAERAAAVAAISQGQMSRALDYVDTNKRETVLTFAERLDSGEDPLALSEEFHAHLQSQQAALREAVKTTAEEETDEDWSREDKKEQDEAQEAFAEALLRQDLMEYLYLFAVWYRDLHVFQTTRDLGGVLNRDQQARLKKDRPVNAEYLAAIEKAWLYIERNLRYDRVFRDLFIALAP